MPFHPRLKNEERLEFARQSVPVYEKRIDHSAIVHSCATVGAHTIVRAGAVIGGQGFGFGVDFVNNVPIRIHHKGGVHIGAFCEIGANTCIDRGTVEDTVIGDNVKIDNLCHIAHNVKVGGNTMIAAGAIICGSAEIGECCWIGPGAIISNKVKVGDGAYVSIGSVVTKDVPAGAHVTGNFAVPHNSFMAWLKRTFVEIP